jgi:hypothetical protein
MFLMFQLRRLDVWPTGDLGVRKGFALAWDVPTPTPKQLDALGERYHPYRSIVAWYCWRALQLYAGAVPTAVTAQPATAQPATAQPAAAQPAAPLQGNPLLRGDLPVQFAVEPGTAADRAPGD